MSGSGAFAAVSRARATSAGQVSGRARATSDQRASACVRSPSRSAASAARFCPARLRERVVGAAGEVLEELARDLVVARHEVRDGAIALGLALLVPGREVLHVLVERARRVLPATCERVRARDVELGLIGPGRLADDAG